jgi:proline racemase/trans-L-3-hydroxyproline dehydratase
MDGNGYLNMCGHGTIDSITSMVNTGMLSAEKDEILVDTPVGIVKCRVSVEGSRVNQVAFTNLPSFVLQEEARIEVEEVGPVALDVVYSGNVYAFVNAERFGFKLVLSEQKQLIHLGQEIKKEANQQLNYRHPANPDINTITNVVFSLKLQNNEAHDRNVNLFGDGQLDMSPCGTGIGAKTALLHKQGKLDIGETFINQGITGTNFTGCVIATSNKAEYPAIIPEITGSDGLQVCTNLLWKRMALIVMDLYYSSRIMS